ncbi:MAG: hypothetical protein WC725_02740 [Patescibacteria group bacterium]|jgi:hypothetical protein
MREPIYQRSLKKALQLVLHHKILWIFGVLSLLLGQLGWNNFIGSLTIFSNEEASFSSYFLAIPWSNIWTGSNIFWSLWLTLVLVTISVLVILLAVVSEGALIAAATSWYKGVKEIKIDESWQKGVKHFKRLLVVHVSKKFLLVSLLVIVNSTINNLTPTKGVFETTMLVLVVMTGILLALAIATIGIFAAGYVVEREISILDSVKKASILFKEHILVSLELSLLLLAIQMGVVLLFMAASTWFLLPFVSFTIIGGFTGSTTFIMTGLMSSVILFFVVAALVGGILNAFATAAWMYMFMKMDHEGVGSSILHLLRFKRD